MFNQQLGASALTLMSALVSISQVGPGLGRSGTRLLQSVAAIGYMVMVAAIGCSIVCLIRAFSGRRESRSQKGEGSD